MAASPLPSRGPKEGGNATSPLHSRGPQQRAEVATSPMPSRGPKRGRKCCVTLAFSGIPNAKRGEQNQKGSPSEGNKIRSGCLTPAFLGAQKRAEMLCHPCILGDPQQRVTKSEVAASPLLFIFFGSRLRTKKSVGRVTKKSVPCFLKKKKQRKKKGNSLIWFFWL